jgi:hypothetical protein
MCADHRVPGGKQNCPYCEAELDGATNVNCEGVPKTGDLTLCIYCTGLCIFDLDRQLRKPTLLELTQIKASPVSWRQVQRVRRAVARVKAERSVRK